MDDRTLPNGSIARLIRGLSYPLEGLRFINQHGLWGMAAVSIGINVVLFLALVAVAWWSVSPYVSWMDQGLSAWASGFEMQVIVVFAALMVWVIWILFAVLALGASSIVLLLIGQAAASPFLDMLSERVENIVLGTPEQPFTVSIITRSILLSLSDLFWGLVYLAAFNIPVFLVSLTAVGAVPASIASFAFSSLLLAVEFIGLPMTRRFVSYRDRWSLIWDSKGLALGFGASSMLLLLVPGLNLILLPLAAVGGTLAFCDLRRSGELQPM
ncbi:MAG: EI24 domain-containing protein [Myxococcota bacterium]